MLGEFLEHGNRLYPPRHPLAADTADQLADSLNLVFAGHEIGHVNLPRGQPESLSSCTNSSQ